MVLDLRRATRCLEVQKDNRTYRGARIGVIKKDFPGQFPGYRVGEVVVFHPEFKPSEGSLLEPRVESGNLTVGSPMNDQWLSRESVHGSLLTTIRTTVEVPKGYVSEVLV